MSFEEARDEVPKDEEHNEGHGYATGNEESSGEVKGDSSYLSEVKKDEENNEVHEVPDEENEVHESKNEVPKEESPQDKIIFLVESKSEVTKRESTEDKINFVVSLLESSEEISDERRATLRLEEKYFRGVAEEEQQHLRQ